MNHDLDYTFIKAKRENKKIHFITWISGEKLLKITICSCGEKKDVVHKLNIDILCQRQ